MRDKSHTETQRHKDKNNYLPKSRFIKTTKDTKAAFVFVPLCLCVFV